MVDKLKGATHRRRTALPQETHRRHRSTEGMNKRSLALVTTTAACVLALGVPKLAPAATPADPAESVVLITVRSASGEGAGTGMVLTASGEVLTNYHVVEGSSEVSVTIPATGKTYSATVVGHDASRDVALLQLQDAEGLATITPDQDVVSTGDTLTAMGNASGGGELVAASGQVTALNQQVTVDDGNGGTETLTGVIETNAGAVPGDSGGPMFDSEGEVTGMTTAGSQTVTRDPGGMRGAGRSMPITTVSYAVPISDALAVVDQIRSGTETATTRIGAKAYLGITVAPAAGVWVNSVLADGPAAEAGLVAGSTITSLDGQAVVSQSDLAGLLAQLEPGQQVTLTWVDPSGSRRRGTIALGTSQVN